MVALLTTGLTGMFPLSRRIYLAAVPSGDTAFWFLYRSLLTGAQEEYSVQSLPGRSTTTAPLHSFSSTAAIRGHYNFLLQPFLLAGL